MNKIFTNPIFILAVVVVIVAIAAFIYFTPGKSANPQGTSTISTSGNMPAVVHTGDTIKVYYTGKFTNGTVFDTNVGNGRPTLNFTVGSGQLIAGFDEGVIGMQLNQTRNLTIPANAAYGQINPALVVSLPRSRFGNENVTVGGEVTETTPDGQQIPGTVTAVNATNVTVNFNPRLAGDTLIFSIKVVGIQGNASS